LSSNARIIRTTKKWLKNVHKEQVIVLIGWAPWDREEWDYQGTMYQVSTRGDSRLPQEVKNRYREWVLSAGDRVAQDQEKNHQQIWDFHQELLERRVNHLFFNTVSSFDLIEDQRDWQNCYLEPYSVDNTYFNVLKSRGFETFEETGHFRTPAHFIWAQYLLPYIAKVI
jgi:hypothetical protein